MEEERILQLLSRVKASQDGPELIEYLQQLSLDNYKAFKKSRPEANEVHKGYAQAIDGLLSCFENCDKLLRAPKEKVSEAADSAWT